jgi:hypothetical protein
MFFQLEFPGEECKRALFDEVGPPHRKGSFLGPGKFPKEKVTHCEVEDGIAKKF